MVLRGQMMAGIGDGLHNTSEMYRHGVAEQKQTSLKLYHQGHQICGNTFWVLHGIGTEIYYYY